MRIHSSVRVDPCDLLQLVKKFWTHVLNVTANGCYHYKPQTVIRVLLNRFLCATDGKMGE
jgi:hypothetical protein